MDERLFRLWLRKLESGKYKCNGGTYLKNKNGAYSAAGVISEYFYKPVKNSEKHYEFNGFWKSLGPELAEKLGTSRGKLNQIRINGYSFLTIVESKTIKESITALKKLLSLN